LEKAEVQSANPTTQTVAIKHFGVAIPYTDPGVTSIAPAVLKQRVFVHIEHDIGAPSPDVAKAQAIQKFLVISESNQIKTKKGDNADEKVILIQKDILVAEQE
jgi:hypothetical protein